MSELVCPKDQAQMRSIERNGVTIERCTECGGIFLDRGELERLIQAEGEFTARGGRDDDDDDRSRGYDDRSSGHGDTSRGHGDRSHGQPGKRRKRGGFLQDFLDFG